MAPAVRRPAAPAGAPVRVKVSTGSFSESSTIVKSNSMDSTARAVGPAANTTWPPKPSSFMVRPATSAAVNSAASKPLKVNGTITSPLRVPPPRRTRKVARPAFSATASSTGSAGRSTLMVTLMSSSSVMAVAWAAPLAVPPLAAGSEAAICTLKFSVDSLSTSPLMCTTKVVTVGKVMVPVTPPLKSASVVPAVSAWVMVQVSSAGAGKATPVRATV